MTGGPLGKKSHSSYRQKLNEEKQHNRILYTYFFTRHVVWFVKIQCLEVAKTRPWARGQQFVPVSSSTWPACMAKISNTSRANLFLFSFVKSNPTWLRPEVFKFEGKKVLLLHKYWWNRHTKPANRYSCLFSTYSGRLASSLKGLFLKGTRPIPLPKCRRNETRSKGAGIALLVRVPDSWWKGCEFESRQERRENFLL